MTRRLLPFLLTQENTPLHNSSFAVFTEHHHRTRRKRTKTRAWTRRKGTKRAWTRTRKTKKKRAWTRRRKMRRREIGGRAGTRKIAGSLVIRKMIDLAKYTCFCFGGGTCYFLKTCILCVGGVH